MLRVAYKFALLMLWTLPLLGLMMALKALKKERAGAWLMQLYSRGFLWIVGVRLSVHGQLSSARPLLVVSNHMSHLDTQVIAAATPVAFAAKSEIAHWPVLGYISKLVDTVFIDRRVHKTLENQNALHKALRGQKPVWLFPEGTTSDGRRVLPFRSSYFNLAEQDGERVTIQPAMLRYTRINNLPVGMADMPKIAWYGDMELLPHVKECFRLGSIHAELHFLPPLEYQENPSRKALAAECQALISKQFYAKPAQG